MTQEARLLKDIYPGQGGSDPSGLFQFQHKLFFVATTPEAGAELWSTDGTSDGTALVKDIFPGGTETEDWHRKHPYQFTILGDQIFFIADDGSGYQLWSSDGTAAGTKLFQKVATYASDTRVSSIDNLHVAGNRLFFTTIGDGKRDLWSLESGSSTASRLNIEDDLQINNGFTSIGNTLFFYADKGFRTANGLYKSDGTAGGTNLVKEITYLDPSTFSTVGNKIYFVASNHDPFSGQADYELWSSNGTAAGTDRVHDINTVGSSSPRHLTAAGTTLYFNASDGQGENEQLYAWRTNINSPIKITNFPASNLTPAGDSLFFVGDNALWKIDNSSDEAIKLHDFSQIDGFSLHVRPYFSYVDGYLYFRAGINNSNYELWRSDGLKNGKIGQFADISPGPYNSYPLEVVKLADKLLFTANDTDSIIDNTNEWWGHGRIHGRELFVIEQDLAQPETEDLPELSIQVLSANKAERHRGTSTFTFTVTRTGDTSSPSTVVWETSGILQANTNPANRHDFSGGKLPTGTVVFLANESNKTIHIKVRADRTKEANESFQVKLSNATGATITQDSAVGIIRNDDLVGNNKKNSLRGTKLAEWIDGMGGQDTLTGGLGADTFAFRFGDSTLRSPDHITDFTWNEDKLTLINSNNQAWIRPDSFSRAADNSNAATLTQLANAVFKDADGATRRAQALSSNSAAIVVAKNASIAGTYIIINNDDPAINPGSDLMIKITEKNGTLLPALGVNPIELLFS